MVLHGAAALAQDSHYWTTEFGNRARLLGRSTIGSTFDISATFYNPGLFALVENPELALAGSAFRYETITIESGLGEGVDLTSSRLGGEPSLFAGEIDIGGPGGQRLGYSLLTRRSFDFRFDQRRDVTDLLDVPIDRATASLRSSLYLNETWAGISWAMPLGSRVGIGVTGYVQVHHQRRETQTLVTLVTGGVGAVALQQPTYDYTQWGVLAKVGVGARFEPWSLGLTVTTPNLRVHGSGAAGYDETVVVGGGGTLAPTIVADYQEDLDTDYRSPASVGFGVSRALGGTRIHAAAEWFAAIDRHAVLDAATVRTPAGEPVAENDLVDARVAVLNWAVGVEHEFRPGLAGYASFRTDGNASDLDTDQNASLTIWDLYHVAAGATFTVLSSELTLGLSYGFGDAETRESLVTAPVAADPQDEQVQVPSGLQARYRVVTAVLGLSLAL